MEDREFADFLYAGWAKTTGSEGMFWMPQDQVDGHPNGYMDIWAVHVDDAGEQTKKHVASFMGIEDSSFISAVHGCLPDLIRRLHSALDEADRLDRQADEREGVIADLEREHDVLAGELEKAKTRVNELQRDLWEEKR